MDEPEKQYVCINVNIPYTGYSNLLSSLRNPKMSSETSVVNVKVEYIRPVYKNLKEWVSDERNVYIGRKGVVFVEKEVVDEKVVEKKPRERFPKTDSIWANPFKVGKEYTREESIRRYEMYIREKLESENSWHLLENLRGKCLGCWCKPEACHGDILLKLLEERVASGASGSGASGSA